MDLGIKGRKAIVCAASKGLGKGCALALAHEGADLVISARTQDVLEAAAAEIRDFDMDDWRRAVEGNMMTPLALIKSTVYGMQERGFHRIVNITSISVKGPIAQLELSDGARAGLTGAVAVLARKASKHIGTINGLLPGPFDTDQLHGTSRSMAQKLGISFEEAQ